MKNEELVMNLVRGAGMLRKDNKPYGYIPIPERLEGEIVILLNERRAS